MVVIASAAKYIKTIQNLDRFPEKERVEAMKIVLPQLRIKKSLMNASPEDLLKMEAALTKAEQAYRKLLERKTETPAPVKPAPSPQKEKTVSRWPAIPSLWKLGLAGIAAYSAWSLYNSNLPILLASLAPTFSRGNIYAMMANPPVLSQVQNFGHMLQNWGLVADGDFLGKPCGDCSDPYNDEDTILKEAAGMQWVEIDGVKVWDASDEALAILFQSRRWSSQSYLPIVSSLLQNKRYQVVEDAIDNGSLKGEYFISVHAPILQRIGAKDPEANRILQKLFCSEATTQEFRRHDSAYGEEILSQFKCPDPVHS